MKIRCNTEIISGAVFAVVGAVLWLLIPSQIQTMEKGAVNAQTLPRIAIGGMVLFAVGLLLEGLFAKEKQELVVTAESFRSAAFSGTKGMASMCRVRAVVAGFREKGTLINLSSGVVWKVLIRRRS